MGSEPKERYLLKLIAASDNVPKRNKAVICMSNSTAELTSEYYAFAFALHKR